MNFVLAFLKILILIHIYLFQILAEASFWQTKCSLLLYYCNIILNKKLAAKMYLLSLQVGLTCMEELFLFLSIDSTAKANFYYHDKFLP